MKPISTSPKAVIFFLLTLTAGWLTSCYDEVKSTYTYKAKIAVFLQMSDIRSQEIKIMPGKALENPGKIYIFHDFLLINEPQKGIHIIDNTNPSSPRAISFIPIPGNVDLAVNANILYADNYADLLAFDITQIQNIRLKKRVEDVFMNHYTDFKTSTILTYKDTVLSYESEVFPFWSRGMGWGGAFFASSEMGRASGGGGESYGQGGSMARFTLMNGHLYTVDDYSLKVFDVQQKDDPNYLKTINLGWGIETIFPFQNKLFIGSNTGMHIYDAVEPAAPKKMAVYQHITACDPVVVNEKYAFVTLRSGVTCRLGVDELQVVDIQDPYQPKLVKAYTMLNPHGLALAGDYLYLAEGKHGLKSFKVNDVMEIDRNQLEFLKSMKAVDIIAGPKSLIVIGEDGVCQFDYSTPAVLKPLSCIQVKNPIV
jgi:hypothetical protein